MTVATSTASGGGAGACFLAQERQTSPARRNIESFFVKKLAFRGCRIRDAGISASDVLRRKLSLDRSPAARRLCAHPDRAPAAGTPFLPRLAWHAPRKLEPHSTNYDIPMTAGSKKL